MLLVTDGQLHVLYLKYYLSLPPRSHWLQGMFKKESLGYVFVNNVPRKWGDGPTITVKFMFVSQITPHRQCASLVRMSTK